MNCTLYQKTFSPTWLPQALCLLYIRRHVEESHALFERRGPTTWSSSARL